MIRSWLFNKVSIRPLRIVLLFNKSRTIFDCIAEDSHNVFRYIFSEYLFVQYVAQYCFYLSWLVVCAIISAVAKASSDSLVKNDDL